MSAAWFDGRPVYGPVRPGTREERHRARLAAAQLVIRHGGTAEDLATILSALALWPEGDRMAPP